MPDPHSPLTPAGDPLDAIIADYVQQVEAGAVPDREALRSEQRLDAFSQGRVLPANLFQQDVRAF